MSVAIPTIAVSTLALGWILLTNTSASLLLPDPNAARDRFAYAVNIPASSSPSNLQLRLRILFHLCSTYAVILPLASFLWAFDDIFFRSYKTVPIVKPLIIISVPRGGTTSFHRTLALDNRFVTPSMLELVMPFLCLHKLVYGLHRMAPTAVQQLERFLKWINGVTSDVEARHPISLFAPDADDILLGEWHWISVGAVRTFPVASSWQHHYQMDAHTKLQRERSLLLHQRMCQKVLYYRGGHDVDDSNSSSKKRLLLRSHLSPCVPDFQRLYPDATILGILRDPIDVLRSFAGLSQVAVKTATGVDMLAATESIASPWPPLFVKILSDMMARESLLYGGDNGETWSEPPDRNPWMGQCHHITFAEFKKDPAQALETIFTRIQLPLTQQMKKAMHQGLGHHETYKTRHTYTNPTLEAMGIDQNAFLTLPGVARYSKLLKQPVSGGDKRIMDSPDHATRINPSLV
jgi:hypothetical protein